MMAKIQEEMEVYLPDKEKKKTVFALNVKMSSTNL